MTKYFIVSDVHGFYDEMIKALTDAGFDKNNQDHIFVSLGDLLDRGNYPMKCLDFVNSLDRKILIRGNHEDLIERVFKTEEISDIDFHNGTAQTVLDIGGYGLVTFSEKEAINLCKNNKELNQYLSSLVDYYEDDKNIFVHGWIPCKVTKTPYDVSYKSVSLRRATKKQWQDARWINGMDAWHHHIRERNKTVFCGHWHCSWGWSHLRNKYKEFPKPNHEDFEKSFQPFVDDGIVAIDACTAYTHKVNCFVVEKE